ncbi:hypothetical protein [Paramesorhizobium deserti]|uniref:hypothetical protein n=1 Tax=Paramesorhizobium deserti TaxID=1494590 RepID=UPI00128FE9B1|nr:hypothetical protein [Paramesorhizobium deserti]
MEGGIHLDANPVPTVAFASSTSSGTLALKSHRELSIVETLQFPTTLTLITPLRYYGMRDRQMMMA